MPRAPQSRKPQRRYRENRPSATKRGYGYWWSNPSRTGWADELFKRFVVQHGAFCSYCERRPAALLDHVIPPSTKGEPGTPAYERWLKDELNLVLCCNQCNVTKGNKPITDQRVLALRPNLPDGTPKPHRQEVMAAHARGNVA